MPKRMFHISGMHCKSCEVLLERELKKLPRVKKCEAFFRNGLVKITCKREISIREVEETIQRCGYQIASATEDNHTLQVHKNTFWDYLQIALIVAIVVFGAVLLDRLELTRFFPEIGDQVNTLIALLLGVVASLSTCLVLVGGIVMSFGNMYPIQEDTQHPFWSRALPHIYFHLGRVGGFILLGGLLGLLGSQLNYSVSFTGYFTILIAIVMLYIGLQILGIVPNITRLGFHLPKKMSDMLHKIQEHDHHLAPILIGALTFFLPCGFTQTMQLAAVASGDFFTGAVTMGAFALGTLPALLVIGVGSSYAKKQKFAFLNRLIGVVVMFFAFYSLNSGLVLAGHSPLLDTWSSGKNATEAVVSNDEQVIKMTVDWNFYPTKFWVKKDVPVRWEIDGVNISGCSNEVVIPKLGISKKIQKGLNIVEFTPTKAGTLPFSCWMGMLNGHFIVTE